MKAIWSKDKGSYDAVISQTNNGKYKAKVTLFTGDYHCRDILNAEFKSFKKAKQTCLNLIKE